MGRWLCIGGCGLGGEVVPPLGMVLGVFPCSIHPQVASPTKRGAGLPAHTSGKPHSICCGMSNKDEEINKQGGILEPGDTAGCHGVKTGARGLKVV